MNDIDKMPSKCQDCAYWELAKYPWCCGDCKDRLRKPVSDFVSRQWLIDEYHRRHEGPPGGALKMIEEAPAADVEPKRKWIPVTERLPDKGQVVLAFGTRSCTTGQFRGTGSEPWFWWWKGNTIKRVTHWMPLPEPPKEEEDEHL